MAQILKTLEQANPAATTLTDFYTVPAATTTVVSSIVICNQASTDATFRISVAVAGAVNSAKQYIYYDTTIYGNDSFVATIGGALGATDVIRIYASSATLSISAFGAENT